MTFFTEHCARNFFFTWELVGFYFMDSLFDSCSSRAAHVYPISTYFFGTKTYFSVHITDFSVYFKLFAILSY